jgi:hypothetical protein
LLVLGALLLTGGSAPAAPEGVRVVIDEPAEGAVVPARFVVRGQVLGAGPEQALLRVNGRNVDEVDGRFEASIEASAEGPLSVRVVRAVVGLPAVTVERVVNVDASPPALEVYEPATEESWHAAGEVTIEGSVVDLHLSAVRMNGQAVALRNQTNFKELFLLPESGSVRVEIEAEDRVGQVTRAVRVLHRTVQGQPVPGTGPVPALPAPEPPTSDRVTLHLESSGRVTLVDGGARGVVEGLTPGGPRAGDALATLRDVLGRVEWQLPRGAAGKPPRRRTLALEAPTAMPWRTAGWLAALPTEDRVRPAAVLLGSPGEAEARVSAPSSGAAATGTPLRLVLRAGSADGAPTTQVDLLHEPLHLHRAGDAARASRREGVSGRVRDELRRRLRADPTIRGVIVVADPDTVPFGDVALVVRLFASAGILQVWLELDPTRPAFGTPAPSAARPPAAVPPSAPAAAPAGPPTAVPPPPESSALRLGGGAFPLRVDRERQRSLGHSLAAEQAIERGLAWLAAHQSEDGGWECEGFARWCDGTVARGEKPDGPGKPMYDTGVTGLALCAFLGAGYTSQGAHAHAKVVRRGLSYLINVQDAEGCFGPRSTQHYIYNHACAALAMVEAYGMTGSPLFLRSAQRALDFIERARNPYFVWRYGVKPGDNDTSVTGWMVSVLHAADLINLDAARRGLAPPLRLDPEAFDGVIAWVDKMTDPDYGRVGYVTRGSGPARPQELMDRFPAEKSESMTAAGVLCRLYAGHDTITDWSIERGAALCASLPVTWNTSDGSIDLYSWFYISQVLWLLGGKRAGAWDELVRREPLSAQRSDGGACSFKGSWDPVDPWGPDGGRIYSTALSLLILETRARVPR